MAFEPPPAGEGLPGAEPVAHDSAGASTAGPTSATAASAATGPTSATGPPSPTADRAARVARVTALGLDHLTVVTFTNDLDGLDREALIAAGHLLPEAPAKGLDAIGGAHRSETGEALLELAKDVLYGLLFGDETTQTRFDRVQRELLTLTLPRAKAGAFDFIPAATELSGAGMWRDPAGVSNDVKADNVIVEVEFGEVAGELVGHGIVRCLSLINNLEINEQVLYARMINVEQSTLIE